MPQIAQQDYLRPQGKTQYDCHLLAALAHNIQQGTIFDTIMSYINGDEEKVNMRISLLQEVADTQTDIYYYDSVSTVMDLISITYTQTQYEGLAAIQDAFEGWDAVPELEKDDGFLYDTLSGDYVTTGGKKLIPTIGEDGLLSDIEISTQEYPGTEISWEDAQKLIGLPCSPND